MAYTKKLKIALLGTRGIPANHGGFETCVEEIGERLVKKGHEVWVYSKKNGQNKHSRLYKGMQIVKIPRIRAKGFETLFSTVLSVLHSILYKFDFYMVFNGANSPALIFYKLFKKKYGLNTDGLEWKRDKWGFLGKNYYKISERISVFLCKNLVSDSQGIHDYYKEKYNADSTIIAYGADIPQQYPENKVSSVLKELGIKKNNYFLQVTRFEPENHPLLTLQAFHRVQTDNKCVIVGGANFRTSYLEKIENEKNKNKNIILPGFIYHKEKLSIVWQNCFCYIHGNSVGGTNPALLQAMAAGRPVIALNCRFNRNTLNGYGYFYERNKESLSSQITYLLKNQEEGEQFAKDALERVQTAYSWDKITEEYEDLFHKIVSG